MAVQIAPGPRADVRAAAAAGLPGLFGTGPTQPAELYGTADLPVGHAVGETGVGPSSLPDPGTPTRSCWQQLNRRLATWGAGADGAYLSWRSTPLRVHRLGGGTTRTTTPAVAGAPVPAAGPPAPPRPAPVDHDLEAAVGFATDFSVDLLRTPVRLAAPAPRLTAPVRSLLAGLRGLARQAATWGSGRHGARLS